MKGNAAAVLSGPAILKRVNALTNMGMVFTKRFVIMWSCAVFAPFSKLVS